MKSTLLFWLVYLINACPLFSIDLPFLPEPYNSVHLMPYKPEGWYNNHGPISELVKRKNMRIVIEVGSWMGQIKKGQDVRFQVAPMLANLETADLTCFGETPNSRKWEPQVFADLAACHDT